jgi:uncharacterized membrane protein
MTKTSNWKRAKRPRAGVAGPYGRPLHPAVVPIPLGHGVPAPLIALSGIAVGLVTVSGHLGGRLAYRYGVRVVDESTQQTGYLSGEATA